MSNAVLGILEKRKEKRERRAAAIARWREAIDKLDWWIGNEFQDSADYSEIRGFLVPSLRGEIEQGRGALTALPARGTLVEGETTKQKLLEAITRVEREEWKLL
jgi:hypothetical protein